MTSCIGLCGWATLSLLLKLLALHRCWPLFTVASCLVGKAKTGSKCQTNSLLLYGLQVRVPFPVLFRRGCYVSLITRAGHMLAEGIGDEGQSALHCSWRKRRESHTGVDWSSVFGEHGCLPFGGEAPAALGHLAATT